MKTRSFLRCYFAVLSAAVVASLPTVARAQALTSAKPTLALNQNPFAFKLGSAPTSKILPTVDAFEAPEIGHAQLSLKSGGDTHFVTKSTDIPFAETIPVVAQKPAPTTGIYRINGQTYPTIRTTYTGDKYRRDFIFLQVPIGR